MNYFFKVSHQDIFIQLFLYFWFPVLFKNFSKIFGKPIGLFGYDAFCNQRPDPVLTQDHRTQG